MANDVYTYVAAQGLITVDSALILNQVGNEYKSVFGQDLVVPDSLNIEGGSTPQGLLIVTEALARIAVADNNAAVANQINPNLAGGVFLDAILALTGIQRNQATYSQAVCTLTGVEGTSIPAGSQAQVESSGAIFQLVNTVVIPSGGSISNVLFTAVLPGQIAADAHDLNIPLSAILGWETIDNPQDAILGQNTQTDVQARQTRVNTLAAQGSSTAQAIISGLIIAGASSVYFLENTAATTETLPEGDVDGVEMVAHSIYACVNGSSNGTQSTAIITLGGTPQTIIPAGSEVSATVDGQTYDFVLNPNVPFVLSGTLTSSSTTITMTSTAGVFVGQAVTGVGIPASSTVSTVTTDTSIVITHAATASGAQDLTFTSTSWVIPASGSFDAPFTSFSYGAIPAPIGSLDTIVTPISGWSTATNAAAATQGTVSTIAQALVSRKSAGASYNNTLGQSQGNAISAVVTVPYSDQIMTVLYDTPATVLINVLITVKVVVPVQDVVTVVQQAIVNYAQGLLSEIPGLTVGQNVSAFEIAGAVTSQFPGVYVASCLIAKSPTTPTTSTEIVIQPYQIASITLDSIEVIVL